MAELLYTCVGKNGRYYWRHRAGNNWKDDGSEQGYRYRWYAAFKARRRFPGMDVTHVGMCKS